MELNEESGAIISQEEAVMFIEAFREKFGDQIVSSFIGRKNIEELLAQEEEGKCVGVRIYNGYNPKLERIALVMVGVDSVGRDMLKAKLIYDEMLVCPPHCIDFGLYPSK
jgi:hypothetical protein